MTVADYIFIATLAVNSVVFAYIGWREGFKSGMLYEANTRLIERLRDQLSSKP